LSASFFIVLQIAFPLRFFDGFALGVTTGAILSSAKTVGTLDWPALTPQELLAQLPSCVIGRIIIELWHIFHSLLFGSRPLPPVAAVVEN
jgi:hypothetical protein